MGRSVRWAALIASSSIACTAQLAGNGDGSVAVDGGSGDGGAARDGGLPACVPGIPVLPWTSPYAAWRRGIPADPTFFPLAVWLQGSWHATELASLGVNIYLGNNAGVDTLAAGDLALLADAGLYAIVGQDAVGLANVNSPTIVGWWMSPDEPDNAQPLSGGGYGPPVAPATLQTQYAMYQAGDSSRPTFLGLGQGVAYDNWEGRGNNAPPESQYVPSADIVGFDIYPYNNCGGDPNEQATCGQFWLSAFGVDRIHQWSTHGEAAWADIETTVISAGTDAGPTPRQTTSEVWLSLIHHANGIIYFIDTWEPSFREDGIFQWPAMVSAVSALNAQVKALAPELNSADIPALVSVSSSNAAAPIDMLVKAQGTSLYIFSAVSRPGTTTGTFQIQAMTGNATATVIGESRTLAVTAGGFSDAFASNDVHLYRVDFSAATCP